MGLAASLGVLAAEPISAQSTVDPDKAMSCWVGSTLLEGQGLVSNEWSALFEAARDIAFPIVWATIEAEGGDFEERIAERARSMMAASRKWSDDKIRYLLMISPSIMQSCEVVIDSQRPELTFSKYFHRESLIGVSAENEAFYSQVLRYAANMKREGVSCEELDSEFSKNYDNFSIVAGEPTYSDLSLTLPGAEMIAESIFSTLNRYAFDRLVGEERLAARDLLVFAHAAGDVCNRGDLGQQPPAGLQADGAVGSSNSIGGMLLDAITDAMR